MRNLICMLLVVLMPLTLASDTQDRFKVYVSVGGGDNADQAVRIIESHLKRELRLLGDVDIVGKEDDWVFKIEIFALARQWKDGTKTGWYAIATYHATRIPESSFNNPVDFPFLQPTYDGVLGAGSYGRESLHEFCITYAGSFDKDKLELVRNRYK